MFDFVCDLMVRAKNIWDRDIVTGVIEQNRYRLPPEFRPDDVIIDIGAHVGSFAHACLLRGAGKVHAFEPDSNNIRLCARNMKRFGRKAVLHRVAVWRSDTSYSEVSYTGPITTSNGLNYGGGNVVFEDGLNIPTRCEALDSYLSNIRNVRLLKVDCESSEWPILLTCRLLECVDEIVGEFHEIGGIHNLAAIPPKAKLPEYFSYTAEDLVLFLSRHGFSVEISRSEGSNIGAFFAKREN